MMNDIHPITIEKRILKDLAGRIHDMKHMLRHIHNQKTLVSRMEMANAQRLLAKFKREYRHRHVALCFIRQALSSKTYGRVETNAKKPLDMKSVNRHRVRILLSITKHYSNKCKVLVNLIKESTCKKEEQPDPMTPICDFIRGGIAEKLYLKDFTLKDNGDYVYFAHKAGIVSNDEIRTIHQKRNVNAGTEITLLKSVMPDIIKYWDHLKSKALIRDGGWFEEEGYISKQTWDNLPPITPLSEIKDIKDIHRKAVIFCLQNYKYSGMKTLGECWKGLPISEHLKKWPNDTYEVCNQRFHKSSKIDHIIDHVAAQQNIARRRNRKYPDVKSNLEKTIANKFDRN